MPLIAPSSVSNSIILFTFKTGFVAFFYLKQIIHSSIMPVMKIVTVFIVRAFIAVHDVTSVECFFMSLKYLNACVQFIDGRLEMLNQAKEPDDLFEEEILQCGASSGCVLFPPVIKFTSYMCCEKRHLHSISALFFHVFTHKIFFP